MTDIGAVFLPGFAPGLLRPTAEAADRAGLDELWLWEDCFQRSGIASMTAALAWTERLRVGIGLLPVPMRNVATTAMEAATLEHHFPGRAVVGVGHGVLDWMGQIGARAGSPLTLLGEYLDALRALLAGETVTTDGRYVRLTDVVLAQPPAAPVPVLAGAEGPKTLALVGAKADGLILPGGTSPDMVRAAVERTAAARADAGRTDPFRVVVFVPAAIGADAAERLTADLARWQHPDDGDFGVAGEPDAVADGLRRWAEAGADAVILQPTGDEADPERYVRRVAEEVAPLLR